MAVTYGFYNSLAGDRVYNATQFSSIFEGIINDGVFMSVGDKLLVVPSSGLTIAVGTGRAWFNGTWTNNDAPILITLDAASPTLSRIDLVILEVDESSAVRANSIKVIKGANASVPTEPTLTNTAEVHQYVLASIYLSPGVTTITASKITNRVGSANTPFVTGILKTVNVDDLLTQWEDEFQTWFEDLQDELDANQASNLQNQINAIEADDWVVNNRILDNTITVAKIQNRTKRIIFPAGGFQYSGSGSTGQRDLYGMKVEKTATTFVPATFQGQIPLDFVSDANIYLAIGWTWYEIPTYTYRVRVLMHKGTGDNISSELDVIYNWSFNSIPGAGITSHISPAIAIPNAQPGWFISGVVSTHVDMTYMALRMAYLEYVADS
jgi:hypothetical protein